MQCNKTSCPGSFQKPVKPHLGNAPLFSPAKLCAATSSVEPFLLVFIPPGSIDQAFRPSLPFFYADSAICLTGFRCLFIKCNKKGFWRRSRFQGRGCLKRSMTTKIEQQTTLSNNVASRTESQACHVAAALIRLMNQGK